MNKKMFLMLSLILLFLPMSFAWYGYGEKGYIGLIAIENPVFVGGWLLFLFSYAFKARWSLYSKRIAVVMVLLSYFYGAWDFCGHIGGKNNLLTVCKLPMWISFIGAVGITIYICFLTEETKKAELE
ncbi:MAG: hypothetical protein IJY52_07320 [Anaerotignum sp.]|nr:hypothetical protein [Anaerotignum sp.]